MNTTRTCRCCLGDDQNCLMPFHSIYSPAGIRSLHIYEVLNEVCTYQHRIDVNDGLSPYICSNCLKTLAIVCQFQEMCLKSETQMRSHTLQATNKIAMSTARVHDVYEMPEASTSTSSASSSRAMNDGQLVGELGANEGGRTSFGRRSLTQPKPRKNFTLADKRNIIRKLESGISNTVLARELQISHSTISTIWKNRNAIADGDDSSGNQRRRLKSTTNCAIETALLEWVKLQQNANAPLNGSLIQEKANEICKALGREYFCSESWVYRFRTRHQIDVTKGQRNHFRQSRKSEDTIRLQRLVS